MSFLLQDKALLNTLYMLELQKKAQVQQPIVVDPEQLKTTGLKFLGQLKQELSGISSDGQPQLFEKHLFNLNALLSWLEENKVKFNNKQIATRQSIAGKAPGYEVDKPGLIAFLKDVRTKAANSDNLFFVELVSKLIDEANKNPEYDAGLRPEVAKEKTPVAAKEKLAPGDYSDVEENPEEKITEISPIVDLKNPRVPSGLAITVGDLSDTGIKNFLAKMTYYEADNDRELKIDWDNPNRKLVCVVLSSLFSLAKEHATDEPKNRKFQYFLYRIYKLMGTKGCAVSSEMMEKEKQTEKSRGNMLEVGYKNEVVVKQKIVEKLKKSNAYGVITLPYNMMTSVFNIRTIRQFITEFRDFITDPEMVQIVPGLNLIQPSIANTLGVVEGSVIEWSATAPQVAREGFIFPTGSGIKIDSFLMTYAQNSKSKGIEMLAKLIPICNQLNALLNAIFAIPSLVSVLKKDEISKQIAVGHSYVSSFEHAINMMRSHG